MSRRYRGPRRSSLRRPLKTTVLIVGEGQQTEPNYFRRLKREEPAQRRFAVTVKGATGFSPTKVVQTALNLCKGSAFRGSRYDEVWCVIDVEGQENAASLREAVEMARKAKVGVCLSNPAFEVWFLAHFERTNRWFIDAGAVIVELNKRWQEMCQQDYRKNDEANYGRVAGKTPVAIHNAKWACEQQMKNGRDIASGNSCTDVYRLVEHLLTGL